MVLTRKEIRRRFYLRHRKKVIKWSRDYFKRTQYDSEKRKKRAKTGLKWERKNKERRGEYKKKWRIKKNNDGWIPYSTDDS